MEKFTVHTGIAAPLLRINIDTDAIIPSREMKRVSKQGLGEGLFAGWRYSEPGGRTPNPDFVLNKPDYQGASILLSGGNFGCGSSREHAVWALHEFGILAVLAPSFGAIFYNNCVRNGILPVVLDDGSIRAIAARVEENPRRNRVTIDLQQCRLNVAGGAQYPFAIEDGHRTMLLDGLDAIDLTLQSSAEIDTFQQRDRALRPWMY